MSNPVKTAADAIRAAAATLSAVGIETARLDAEVLLRHVLGLDRTRLFARLRDPITADEITAFGDLIARRSTGTPVAYLTGVREFMGLSFAVGPGVLIPRPETELLVEWALEWLAPRPGATIVDVGTGSGAIAVSLAAALGGDRADRIIGSDVSAMALGFAGRNGERHAAGRVSFVRGDLVSWCGGDRVDLLLANLPYLTPDQLAGNPDLHAEPALSLVAGSDGLDAIDRLVVDTPRVLRPGGTFALELDPSQAAGVSARLRSVLPGADVTIIRDLAGLDRFVVARSAAHATFR